LAVREQALLAGIGVFAGGLRLGAAQMVLGTAHATLDSLAALVEHSLVGRMERGEGEQRFVLLEVVREYALDRLAAIGQVDAVRQRHARMFVAYAEQAEIGLRGPEQRAWLARLDSERMNLAAALAWALADRLPIPASVDGTHFIRPNAEIAVRLVCALVSYWWRRGYAGEGHRWVTLALAATGEIDLQLRARLLAQAGRLAWHQGEYATAAARSDEALRLCRTSGDTGSAAFPLATLGMVAWHQGESALAEQYLTESLALAEADGNDWAQAAACLVLGLVAYNRGEHERRAMFLERSLTLARGCEDSAGIAEALLWSANMAVEQGDLDAAEPGYREALARYHALGDHGGVARSLHKLADLSHDRGDLAGARALFDECLATLRALGDRVGIGDALIGLGDVLLNHGELDRATGAYTEALTLIQARGGPVDRAWAIRGLARVAHAWGDHARGRQLFEESLRLAWVQANPWGIAVCLEGLAGVIAALGQPALAAELFGAADRIRADRHLRAVPGALPDVDRDRAAVYATLGATAFAEACARGGAYPIEHVISRMQTG
jgi:tetratricopeptide (TPR) repeat protein